MSKTYHNKKNKPTTGTFYLDFLSVSFITHKNLQSTVDFNESIIYKKKIRLSNTKVKLDKLLMTYQYIITVSYSQYFYSFSLLFL